MSCLDITLTIAVVVVVVIVVSPTQKLFDLNGEKDLRLALYVCRIFWPCSFRSRLMMEC